MCGEVLGFQLIGSHPLQKHGDVALPVLLGGAEGEPAAPSGNLSTNPPIHKSTEDAKRKDASSLAAGHDRLTHPLSGGWSVAANAA